ncbi:GNAT family protein [Knoellia sp. 3-2P3]|uniref:GNAT family N-acetyltransferase n=1 Tax=unclassified Knoellia TaxID=2618719 RepID=UPI0023D9C75F|nr:GNAT family protein [Knoellia sp. 3-2P3]MDF2092221.1 GNAT family protein [Knoellia sp. 3-2P3]
MTTTYELRVEGRLDSHWSGHLGSALLGGLSLSHEDDGTSTLTCPVADQAQLYGLLAGLRDIGASLLSVRAVPGEVGQAPGPLARLAWPRRTERLTLRPARPEDAGSTWRLRRLESVARWLTEAPTSLDAYRLAFEDPARLAATVVVELDGRVVGDLMLRVEDAWGQREVAERAQRSQAELGWVLDPAFEGRGYATEAVRELVRMCFEDLGLRRVVATCVAENESSWRLMERLGMRREQHAVEDALHRSGAWLDSYGYALLANEWAVRRQSMVTASPSSRTVSKPSRS